MEKRDLERWLYGDDANPPSPAAIATALGLAIEQVADTTLLRTAVRVRSLRFILAVLHDVFAADIEMWMWLETPRDELNGASPRQSLLAGRADAVEQLAIRAWNHRSAMMVA